jgi:putative flippase GtrA
MLQKTRTRVQALPQGVRQFLKFATVGAMNTAIDWSLAFLLTYYTPLPRILGAGFVNLTGAPVRPEAAAVWCTKIISSGTATINSFIWNRRWTFRMRDKRARARQFAKFVTVNVIGMLLNSTITTLLLRPFLPEPPRHGVSGVPSDGDRDCAVLELLREQVLDFSQRVWGIYRVLDRRHRRWISCCWS